ncbi:MAG TPA: LysM peptidoglycan-binding domain-containing protein [Syntrophales bacterium]|nr:LysM peptidoglycan-binding domain-containing protein [Syntrophales bacterium]HOL59692.1 LysM peptidoglycan-binding domain-containing protein [Syntrophales bacterium]HPO35838.1 LysM peptidoglycan-binding domain-containing protein [Syntrophales bacterium]
MRKLPTCILSVVALVVLSISHPSFGEGNKPHLLKETNPTEKLAEKGIKAEDSLEQDEDVIEQALSLVGEADAKWKAGRLEEALELLDQAYAIMLDTNGDTKVARQKDDLRLLISKKIVTIYSSMQRSTKGKRGEIPLVMNEDVEKEIRSFLGPEREFFLSSYQRSFRFRPMIKEELKKAGLPEELSWLPLVESGFKISALSPARALGLWQFIPSTGYKYGLNRDDWVDERLDPLKSTKAAISYLRDLHGMFGDWLTVLAAYNCGEGRVARVISAQQINYLDRFWDLYQALPYETARYVPRFLATLHLIREPKKYGLDLENVKPLPENANYEVVTVSRQTHLKDIASALGVSEDELSLLNPELRFKITPERPYELKIPSGLKEKFLALAEEIPHWTEPLPLAKRKGRAIYVAHRVRPGESVYTIARKYGTTTKAIRASNRLGKREVKVGQRIVVPIARAAHSPAPQVKAEDTGLYRVKKGDTLLTISQKFGIPADEIKQINGLKSNTLLVGQVIRLKKATTAAAKTTRSKRSTYVVKKGDTLIRIAQRNNIDVERLKTLNKIRGNGDSLKVGQVLVIN